MSEFWVIYSLGSVAVVLMAVISTCCYLRVYNSRVFNVRAVVTFLFAVAFSWIGAGIYLYDIYDLYKDRVVFSVEITEKEKKKPNNMKRFFKVRTGKLLQSVAIWPNLHFNWFDTQGVKSKYIQLAFLLWYVEFSYSEVR